MVESLKRIFSNALAGEHSIARADCCRDTRLCSPHTGNWSQSRYAEMSHIHNPWLMETEIALQIPCRILHPYTQMQVIW